MTSGKNIVVLGSCSVDFTSYAKKLPSPGETIHGYKFATTFGGKGANQCVAAAKLGGKTIMIARVGDDEWGRNYIKNFDENRVDTRNVSISHGVTTGIAQINVSKSGENQIVIVPGANSKLSRDDVKNARDIIRNAAVLVCQLETPIDTTLAAFEICNGIKILNAAPGLPNLSRELLLLTTILCVNESEAEIITGKSFDSCGVVEMLSELIKTGCQTAILTLGSKGAAFITKESPEVIQVPCEVVKAVDTTGAGDSFIGALATLLSFNDPKISLREIVGAACNVASISVTLEGTQTSYPSLDIRTMLPK